MLELFRPAVSLFILLSVATGIAYPLAVTAIAQTLFPHQALGSLIVEDGKVVGSSLIGQPFASPKYFWSRPSASTPVPYNAAASAGSNLGPLNPALQQAVADRITVLRADAPDASRPVPVDLVTASASGLDPHVSPAAADFQIPRVAAARGLAPERVRSLVDAHTEGRSFGVLGEPRVNVVLLNRALDRMR